MKFFLATAAVCGSIGALASPLNKRQATSTLSVISINSGAVSSLASSARSSSAVSASSTASSASSASAPVPVPVPASASASASASSSIFSSGNVPVPSVVPSAAPSTGPVYQYTCPSPWLLTYVELQQNYQASLQEVLGVVGNWTDALYLGQNASTGVYNETGATRTLSLGGITLVEQLVNYTVNPATGLVQEVSSLTNGPINITTLSVYNYTNVLQAYTNGTNTAVTTVKWFSNFCASEQPLGITVFSQFIQTGLNNIQTALSSGSASSGSASGSASGVAPVPIASSAASSASSAAASSSAVSSAASSGIVNPISAASSAAAGGASSSAASAAPSGAAGALLINTPPSLIECQPAALTFSGGSGPYFLSVLPGGQTSATPIEQFPQQATAGSYTWVVNVPAGTAITLRLSDSTGSINYSAPVTIQSGSSNSCISAASASASA